MFVEHPFRVKYRCRIRSDPTPPELSHPQETLINMTTAAIHPTYGYDTGSPRVSPDRPRRLPAEVYRRRRVAAAVVIVTFVALVAWSMAALVGAWFTDQADASVGVGPDDLAVTVASPGDTLWSIAATIDTDGDLRDTVDRLVELNGTSTLAVGQRVVLPTP